MEWAWMRVKESEKEKKYRGKHYTYIYRKAIYSVPRDARTSRVALATLYSYIYVYNIQHISQSDAVYIYKYSRVTPEPSVYICVGV